MTIKKESVLLAVGAGALMMMSKKKTGFRSSYSSSSVDWLENSLLILDKECESIAKKVDPVAHDTFITNRFHQLMRDGVTDTHAITIQILKDNSVHCPWDDQSRWTELMRGLYEQLFAGVEGYKAQINKNS